MTSLEIDTVTGELVPAESRNLFHTNDPVEVLEAAKRIADAFKGAMTQGDMVVKIKDSEHVTLEGWQTVGAPLGVTPHTVWSRPLADGSGWEARAEAKTVAGLVVGTAESMCTRTEPSWARKPDFQLRSMAQTRAQSKAMSSPLRFIVKLAGLSGTPAEEMDHESYGPAASNKQVGDALRAATILYDDDAHAGTLMLRLEQDAGDYLPRIVARAVMFMAAHRPGTEEVNADEGDAGTGTEVESEDTPTPDGPTETTDPNPELDGEEGTPEAS